MSVEISVIVCTHNRAPLLTGALKGLTSQTLEASLYEVIVVDNNSTDDTRAVTELFANKGPAMRYILEPEVGLSYARNRGFQEAGGQYIAYTDDDCDLPARWLEVAFRTMKTSHPGVFGGPHVPFYNSPKPRWYLDSYGARNFGDKPRELGSGEYLIGNNIFFRSDLLEASGGFDPGLGMTGEIVAYGEETALQRRIRETMPTEVIYYDPGLLVYHLVRPEQMTFPWMVRAFLAKGRDVYLSSGPIATETPSRPLLLLDMLKTTILIATNAVKALFRRDRSQYPYFQNYFFEHLSYYLRRLGRLRFQLRRMEPGR